MLRIFCFSVLGWGCALTAQDLGLVAPSPVPSQIEFTPEELSELFDVGEVLVDELKALVFGSSEQAVAAVEITSGVAFTDAAWLDTPDVRNGLNLFLGRPVDREILQTLPAALRLYLAELGYPFSVIYLPEQDITEGVIRVVVVRSTVATDVRIEGARYFSERQYRRALRLEPGTPLNQLNLQADIEGLNRNPFRTVAIQAEAGEEPGTTQLVLQVREARPFRAFVGYNNTGTNVTTEDRMFAGFNWGNAFGLGHLMTLQVTTDFEVKYSKAVSGNYTMELRNNHTLTLFGAYSEIEGVPRDGLEQEGTSWQTGLSHTIPLPSGMRNYLHYIELGLDYKSSDNNLELNLPPFIIPISDNLTRVAQARLTYGGSFRDRWGGTQFGAKLTYSPGGIGPNNDNESFEGSRAFATADYLYASLSLFRDTPIAFSFLSGANWTVRSEFQVSDSNLLSSEQFSAGGSGSVRGYEEGEVIGDNAFFISQEFLLPAFNPTINLHFHKFTSSVRPFLFLDYARTWNTDKLEGESPFNLMSAGTGLRWQVSRHGSFNAAYGWQLRESGRSSSNDSGRAHIALQISY
jgi:hemolysin activation/secretion protein